MGKIVAFVDEATDSVEVFCVDVNASGSSTAEGSLALANSLAPLGFGPGQTRASKPDLKALLTKHCQLPGVSGAGHFVFKMPVVLQQAHDEVVRSLKVPALKEAASLLFGSAQSGSKADVQAAGRGGGQAAR